MELSEGQLVTPTLRLRRLLGQGGMGSVWLADHLALQTAVAIKFLSNDGATSSEAVQRFQREATAAAQIRSPHVVQTLDHGVTTDNTPYIVLELLEGESLGQRLERSPTLSLPEATRVLVQTCKALTKAHGMGVVHRDIKPDNLFLVDMDGEPFVKVLDFGIAKQTTAGATDMTATNSMIGTPYYMSPEQAFSSKSVDSRADLWALAVVLYQALTGVLPFDGETIGAICVAIDRAEFEPVSRRRPGLPAGLDGWFARALARKLDRRFASAREMSEAFLQAIGEDSPASMMMSGRASFASTSNIEPGAPAKRWPLIAVAFVVALGIGGFLAFRGQAPATTTGASDPSSPATSASASPTTSSPIAASAPTATTAIAGTTGTTTPTTTAPTTTPTTTGKTRPGRGTGEVVIDDSRPPPTTTAAPTRPTTTATSTPTPRPKEVDRGF
jgi:serine/threonine-protein kinase